MYENFLGLGVFAPIVSDDNCTDYAGNGWKQPINTQPEMIPDCRWHIPFPVEGA